MAANIRQLLDMRQRAVRELKKLGVAKEEKILGYNESVLYWECPQVDPVSDRRLFCKAHAHSSVVERLGHAAELEGHRGCVNCLEWNSDGSLLASGSDDLTAIMWDPLAKKQLASLPTGHSGNIFSIKFVPFSGDNLLLTGAEDKEVRLHDITSMETTRVWSCCQNRVKRIGVCPNSPSLCWVASEDACIRQLDIREPHSCSGDGSCRNVILDLKPCCNPSPSCTQCKCVAINPVRSEQMAVGALDPYVRLYDRRVMRLTRSVREIQEGAVAGYLAYFCPGNISNPRTNFDTMSKRGVPTVATTYVTFSPDGSELLANMSCENVYIYDLTRFRDPLRFEYQPGRFTSIKEEQRNPWPYRQRNPSTVAPLVNPSLISRTLPLPSPLTEPGDEEREGGVEERVQAAKDRGNVFYRSGKLTEAIEMYSLAIAMDPTWHIPYSNRATAYFGRKWNGDYYAAMRDVEKVLLLCPMHKKAHMRRLRLMHALGWYEEGSRMTRKFQPLFPGETEFSDKMKFDCDKAAALETSKVLLLRNGHGTKRRNIQLSQWENSKEYRAFDYSHRFTGHSNAHTDIKEANFLGEQGEYVAAGSDDGNIFVWEKATGNIVRVLHGDDSIVNCVQWHPTGPMLATSGIASTVNLWEPKPVDREDLHLVKDAYKTCKENQHRMKVDPFEVMLMRMGFNIASSNGEGDSDEGEESDEGEGRRAGGRGRPPGWMNDPAACRQS